MIHTDDQHPGLQWVQDNIELDGKVVYRGFGVSYSTYGTGISLVAQRGHHVHSQLISPSAARDLAAALLIAAERAEQE